MTRFGKLLFFLGLASLQAGQTVQAQPTFHGVATLSQFDAEARRLSASVGKPIEAAPTPICSMYSVASSGPGHGEFTQRFAVRSAELESAGIHYVGPQHDLQSKTLDALPPGTRRLVFSIGPKPIDSPGFLSAASDFAPYTASLSSAVQSPAWDRVAMIDLNPEELRTWHPLDMRYLRSFSDWMRSLGPKGRPIYQYQPANRSADQLVTIGRYVDYLGVGVYVDYDGHSVDRVWVGQTVRTLIQAARELNGRVTPIIVLPAFIDVPPTVNGPPSAAIIHDVFRAVADGGRNFFVFSDYVRPGVAQYESIKAVYMSALPLLCRPDDAIAQVLWNNDGASIWGTDVSTTAGVPLVVGKMYRKSGRSLILIVNSAPTSQHFSYNRNVCNAISSSSVYYTSRATAFDHCSPSGILLRPYEVRLYFGTY